MGALLSRSPRHAQERAPQIYAARSELALTSSRSRFRPFLRLRAKRGGAPYVVRPLPQPPTPLCVRVPMSGRAGPRKVAASRTGACAWLRAGREVGARGLCPQRRKDRAAGARARSHARCTQVRGGLRLQIDPMAIPRIGAGSTAGRPQIGRTPGHPELDSYPPPRRLRLVLDPPVLRPKLAP